MFKSVDELNKFEFDDCIMSSFEIEENEICMELDSLIVASNNSQNTNFTRSYADTARFVLKNAVITGITLAGYKVYDANDQLLEEVPDKEVPEGEWKEVVKLFKDAYLYRVLEDVDGDDRKIDLEIEFPTHEAVADLRDDSYIVHVVAKGSIITWERYLNRVQQ